MKLKNRIRRIETLLQVNAAVANDKSYSSDVLKGLETAIDKLADVLGYVIEIYGNEVFLEKKTPKK